MTLKKKNFRFVFTGAAFKWLHPAEVLGTHRDCTDMTDTEFEAFVSSLSA